MKTTDYFKSTTFFYNNFILKKILDNKLSLEEFVLLVYFTNLHVDKLDIKDVQKKTFRFFLFQFKVVSSFFNFLFQLNLIAAHLTNLKPDDEGCNADNNHTYHNLEPETLPDVWLFDDDDWLRRLTLNFISVFRHNCKLVSARLKVSVRNVSEI